MKKQIVLLALAAAVMLLFSCNKNKGETDRPPPRTYESSKPATESYSFNKGYSLRVNAGFYKIEDNKDTGDETAVAVWASNLALGENVMVGRPRKLTFIDNAKKKNVWDFIEIQLDDKNKTRGYALENQIAGGGYLAVVFDEKALLYSAANATKPTNTVVTKKTVVVYYPESESSGFVEVKGWDCDPTKKNRLIPDNRYMRLSSISKDEPDIQTSILLQTALTMTTDAQSVARETLLKTALQDYPGSVFSDEIRTLLNNPNSANNEGIF